MQDNFLGILTLFLFTFTTLTILLIVLAVYIYKKKKKPAAQPENERARSELGFVVETFHELVNKLKEEEQKLERLRELAEEKALTIEVYNENILQSVPSGVISIDNELKIKSINRAAEYILGINAQDAAGKDFNEIFDDAFSAFIRENRTASRVELPYITADKRHIWLGFTASELKNAEGEKIGHIFVFTDLTDIKALQAQMELKERLSQLGEMSAGISHEFRNSMSVISGYARLLGKKVEPSVKPTVDAIVEEVKNMDKIISELLTFAKPDALLKEDAELSDLIRETVASALGDGSRVRLSITSESPVSIKADVVLLRQALSNLFFNAVDAMPEGGSIDVALRRIQNTAEISIRDTGTGMPEEIRRKIFLPFFTTKQKGFGLGLALVQKIIVSHGGSIEVESREGEGTTFKLLLPCG